MYEKIDRGRAERPRSRCRDVRRRESEHTPNGGKSFNWVVPAWPVGAYAARSTASRWCKSARGPHPAGGGVVVGGRMYVVKHRCPFAHVGISLMTIASMFRSDCRMTAHLPQFIVRAKIVSTSNRC